MNFKKNSQWNVYHYIGIALLSLIMFKAVQKPLVVLSKFAPTIFFFIFAVYSVVLHELAHAYSAFYFGDPTGKLTGRLSFNPIKHLDLMGVFCLFAFGIGWAKPVMVNSDRFKNPKRDLAFVSFAGPLTNLIIMIVLLKILVELSNSNFMLSLTPGISFILMDSLIKGIKMAFSLNAVLTVFNLLPIPPLDGSKILMMFLPIKMVRKYSKIEPYGFIIIMVLVFTGFLSQILFPLVNFLTIAVQNFVV